MRAANRPLTLQRLKEVLSYNRRSGIFRWKLKLSRRNHVGDRAGYVDTNGYRIIQIDGWHYKAARLAWLYCNGRWPDPTADHRDLDRDNNRIRNLREATYSQNNMNVGILPTNTSGFKGVSRGSLNRSKPFRAQIRTEVGRKFLGWFATAEDAGAAYRAEAAKHHGDFVRT